jgi:predicted acyltransferase
MSNAFVSPDVRITSLDQFRGYSVAAMFVVNFLGGLAITHQVLRHNNTHFSLADSIMPSFIFACGFSYRMVFLKQRTGVGEAKPYRRFMKRSLGLLLLSLMLFGFGTKLGSWSEFSSQRVGRFFSELLKADLWEVLAIVGATQIFLLPWIGRPAWIRAAAFIVFGLMHVCLSWSFNYSFVYGLPNWMDAYFGAAGRRAWDGGFFGLVAWSQVMLAGAIAYDAMGCCRRETATSMMIVSGVLLMLGGYVLSCMTTLYNTKDLTADQVAVISGSPVVPDFSRAWGRTWVQMLAEPPFVAPPPAKERVPNYWMMDKRIVSQPFVLFSTGFALSLYGIFMFACDIRDYRLGIFELFGKNPLVAYIIHHFVSHSILAIVPKDSPLMWCLAGLVASFGITYVFVKFLDDRKLYLRL